MYHIGLVEDISNQKNKYSNFFTGITIDNTSPELSFEELLNENKKSTGYIYSSEKIKPLDGWNVSTNNQIMSKTYLNATYYPVSIEDYAGNISKTFVDIKSASYLDLKYVTYDNYSIFSKANAGEIAGKNTILDMKNSKTEALFIKATTNTEKTILSAKYYLHTYWPNGLRGLCNYSENSFLCGNNPKNDSDWINVGKDNFAIVAGTYYTELGGCGINYPNAKVNSGNKLPPDIASKNLYGISSLSLKLSDNFSDYSIVYQIYINGIGWLNTAYDGENLKYSLDSPFSAIRINIIPKSEKNYIINYWNENTYTNNI